MNAFASIVLSTLAVGLLAQAPAALFDYDPSLPLEVKETSRREEQGARLRDITYATLTKGTNAATLITPPTPAGGAAPAAAGAAGAGRAVRALVWPAGSDVQPDPVHPGRDRAGRTRRDLAARRYPLVGAHLFPDSHARRRLHALGPAGPRLTPRARRAGGAAGNRPGPARGWRARPRRGGRPACRGRR